LPGRVERECSGALTIIVVGAATLALTKIKPVWVIVVGAVAGILSNSPG
jgi:hypothetical protein